ncbi:hypothetical protein J7E96_01280 [Streptomyces sp. ISL-96]|uniref:hypothetical protein n=1 Tax=Streptomyces sp. ISL-96 TaxID=2819191 RepID=UPI001BE939FA|nr:hypothetical protein [Streptomyces sp. ISL-96]MBT2487193.1 hypothetical protein [Streptomyces sp. ISL-96]
MTPFPHDSPPPVLVEALLLRHDPAEGFAYRRLITALRYRPDPDQTVRRLALLDEGDDRHIVHSTSWRATHDGHIVLTYLVHPDPDPRRPGTTLPDPHDIACSPRPGHPAPTDLSLDQVAAHAVRHLAFLGRTDPAIAAHLEPRPHLRHALDTVPGVPAGQLQPL